MRAIPLSPITTRSRNRRRTVALLLATAAAAAGRAEPEGALDPAPDVEVLVGQALSRAPSEAALRERLNAARAEVALAGAWPDPMLELMVQDAGFPRYTIGEEEMSMAGLQASQLLPTAGKRRLRTRLAEGEVEMRRWQLEALRRRLAATVRTTYGNLYMVDRELRVLHDARELLEVLTATANARYASGEVEQEAVLKAQLQQTRLGERTDDLHVERQRLVAALARLLDAEAGFALGEVRELPAVRADLAASLPAQAERASAEVGMALAEQAVGSRKLDLARAERTPDVTAGVGIFSRGGFDPVLTVSVGIELPLSRGRKQDAMAQAALHEAEAAGNALRDARAMARAEAARLSVAWERGRRQVERYEQGILPQTSAAVDAARSSYLVGRGDFSMVVEDFELWLMARAELARRQAEVYMAEVEMMELLGDPASSASSPGSSAPEQE